jgi:hypothetical protein
VEKDYRINSAEFWYEPNYTGESFKHKVRSDFTFPENLPREFPFQSMKLPRGARINCREPHIFEPIMIGPGDYPNVGQQLAKCREFAVFYDDDTAAYIRIKLVGARKEAYTLQFDAQGLDELIVKNSEVGSKEDSHVGIVLTDDIIRCDLRIRDVATNVYLATGACNFKLSLNMFRDVQIEILDLQMDNHVEKVRVTVKGDTLERWSELTFTVEDER